MAFIVPQIEQNLNIRRERDFKPRKSLDEVCAREIANYRFPREFIRQLCVEYGASIYANKTEKSHAVPAETEFLMALRWYSKGGMLSEAAAFHGISKPSASRVVNKVSKYLVSISQQHIGYPDDRNELANIARQFNTKFRIPSTIGCIDGTHVLIKGPAREEWTYVNRKGTHSLNTQIICDGQMLIRDLECRWPGSTHDSYMLAMSTIYDRFEDDDDFDGYWLLGDSGYGCKRWLLTPLLRPTTEPERRYNNRQKMARSIVERCIGLLKSRFRCLHSTGGVLQLLPERSCRVVLACAVLHNMAVRLNLQDPEEVVDGNDRDAAQDGGNAGRQDGRDGVRVRQALIQNLFT